MKLNLGKKISKELDSVLLNCYYFGKENNSTVTIPILVRSIFSTPSQSLGTFVGRNGVNVKSILESLDKIIERDKKSHLGPNMSKWSNPEENFLDTDVTEILTIAKFESDTVLGEEELSDIAVLMACIKYSEEIDIMLAGNNVNYSKLLEDNKVRLTKKTLSWEDNNTIKDDFNSEKLSGGILGELFNELFRGGPGAFGPLSSPNIGGAPKNEQKPENNNENNNFKNSYGGFGMNEDEDLDRALKENGDSKTPFLDTYCKLMNEEAKKGEYDPIIGREKELEELIEILCCRKKNNAAIIGENGAGKSSLVEKLAQKLAENDVPFALRGKKLYMLDTIALIGGTKFRGEFEARLQGIINEVLSDPDIILNVPELHTLSGLGSSSGSSNDATNFLKPYLTNKNFRLIGTTTFEEYKKFIMSDKALMRRFQTVVVKVSEKEDTLKILENLKTKYEEHHCVSYTPEAIKACIEYTDRYIMDRNQPDKSIDILDMAGSRVKLMSGGFDKDKAKELENKIKESQENKKQAIKDQDFDKAGQYRENELKYTKELEKELEKGKPAAKSKWPKVTEEDVASVVGKITGVKVEKITSDEMEKLRELKSAMTAQIIGQDEAIDEIVVNLQKSRLGLRDPKKPIFCGFLAGKTGVGKSLTAKLIAKEFFGSEDAHINISMSQFTNASDASKLLGAAAGYIGYEDSNIFDQVRNKPYSLVTFEEAEKADPSIFQQLLKVLDEGIIEMSDGSEINFRNCIILFTSNLGTKELMSGKIGFDDGNRENSVKRDQNTVVTAIKKFFRPEFINRLDSIIVYNSLGKKELTKIVDLEIKDPINRVLKAGYKVKLPKGIQEFIVSKGREEYGAREIKRNISSLILDPICKIILEPENQDKKKINIKIDKEKDELVFDVM